MGETRPKPKSGRQIALRVGEALLLAIDAGVARLRRARPGANPQRSDAVGEILHQILHQVLHRALLQRSIARG